MNLQEVLNYRTKCFICGRRLLTQSLDLADVSTARNNEGLLVQAGKREEYSVFFKYDGTYEKMKKWNSLYVKPLSLVRECPKCVPEKDLITDTTMMTASSTFGTGKKPPILLKSRSVGASTGMGTMVSNYLMATSLDSLKDLRSAYCFQIFGDDEGNFDCKLQWEDIRFHDNIDFYHVKTNFTENTTNLRMGNFKSDTIDSIVRIDVPAIKTNKCFDVNSLIDKLKLYNTFS